MLGSGNHARTYLHLTRRNTLQQLPLGWYAEKGGYWAMNPGYDRPEYQGSTRVIHYECMFCHNGYPGIPAGHQEDGARRNMQPIPKESIAKDAMGLVAATSRRLESQGPGRRRFAPQS